MKNGKIYSFLETSQHVDLEKLKEFLSERLPYYAIPIKFYIFNELPRNQNEKLDMNKIFALVPD